MMHTEVRCTIFGRYYMPSGHVHQQGCFPNIFLQSNILDLFLFVLSNNLAMKYIPLEVDIYQNHLHF